MAQIYVSEKTKELLEEISSKDRRTQDGEILYLLDNRRRELAILEAARELKM
jgi:hypothetical protein